LVDRQEKSNVVHWEAPPERPYQYPWTEIALELRRHPMQWAKIFEGDRATVATALRQGSITVLHPDLGFEIRTANNTRTGIRTCDLYLRWNPNRVHDTAAVLRTARQIKEEA
jgi:hypothetical protein